jgi:hypothetical protein
VNRKIIITPRPRFPESPRTWRLLRPERTSRVGALLESTPMRRAPWRVCARCSAVRQHGQSNSRRFIIR